MSRPPEGFGALKSAGGRAASPATGRLGQPILPREHGAWVVLYASFLAGTGIAGRLGLPVVLLLVGLTALALLVGPLTVLVRGGAVAAAARRRASGWLGLYLAAAAGALLPLLVVFRLQFLLPFGGAAVACLAARMLLLRGRAERSLAAEGIGLGALCLAGPLAHAVALGRLEADAVLVWVLLVLFFVSGLLYVRMRIQETLARRTGRGRSPAFWPCLLYHLGLAVVVPGLATAGVVPWGTLGAFAPAAWRGLGGGGMPLNVKRLGWAETARAAAFVLLLIASFRWDGPA